MDRGIRPYASSAKNYNEMMDEETEQYYKSRNFTINPSLKQPYTFNNYTEMMYLYSNGEQKPSSDKAADANITPVVLTTVTSPYIEFFDFFVEPTVTSNYLINEEFTNLDDWTIDDSGSEGIVHEIDPAGEFHGYVLWDGGRFNSFGNIATTYTSTVIPTSYTIEFEMKIDTIGADTNSKIYFFMDDDGPANFMLIFRVGGVYDQELTQIGTVVPNANETASYQKWKVVHTSTGEATSTVELFLETDGSYVSQGSISCAYAIDSPIDGFRFYYTSKDATATEIHIRDIKLYYE